jgi:S-disulfanyl-L-cysteine oxidoreductase SoxD
MIRTRLIASVLASSVLMACRSDNTSRAPGAAATAGGGTALTSFADYDAGAVAGGPGTAKRYALGRTTASGDLEKMNTDVGGDGAELPAGRGTVAAGATLYAAQCASCHGKAGEGIAPVYPALVGRDPKAEKFVFATDPKLPHTIGNYWPYAPPLFDYIKRAMPVSAPGSLSNDQVYALTAYLLAANQVIADSTVLDAAALRKVRMPYVDRFVPDDRKPDRAAK